MFYSYLMRYMHNAEVVFISLAGSLADAKAKNLSATFRVGSKPT